MSGSAKASHYLGEVEKSNLTVCHSSNIQNRMMYVEVIASQSSVVF